MPPKPKTPEQLLQEKEQIIDKAVKLIAKSGLENFSMRKLSGLLGMSPANLYNYFYSRDEVNIAIRVRGFSLLHDTYDHQVSAHTEPAKRLEAYVRSFIQFGILHPEYYQLMFTANEPKYFDYVGTPLEQPAFLEKQNAMQSFDYLQNLLRENISDGSDQYYHVTTARIVCEIHGVISLYHSNMLTEMSVTSDVVTESLVNHILSDIASLS